MESIRLTRVGPGEIAATATASRSTSCATARRRRRRVRPQPPAGRGRGTAYKQMMGPFEGLRRSAMGFLWLSTPRGDGARRRRARRSARRPRLPAAAAEGDRARPADPSDEPGGAGIRRDEAALRRLHRLLVGKSAADEPLQMFCRSATPRRAGRRRGAASRRSFAREAQRAGARRSGDAGAAAARHHRADAPRAARRFSRHTARWPRPRGDKVRLLDCGRHRPCPGRLRRPSASTPSPRKPASTRC